MSENKDLAIFGGNSAELPAHLALKDEPQLGKENLTKEDFAIPQIKILQAMNTELLQKLDGAVPGKLYHTISQELFDSIYVMNLKYEREFTIFKKRELGGGYNGTYDSLEAANAAASDLSGTIADYEITETAKHLVLLLDANGKPLELALIFMSRSQLEVSRVWNSNIERLCKDTHRFARVFQLGVTTKSNSQGSWYVFEPQDAGWATEELCEIAKKEYLAMEGKPLIEQQADEKAA